MDIDIDFFNRNLVLDLLPHRIAMRVQKGETVKHNTGIYFQEIPHNPFTNVATIDYHVAEQQGYFKLDFLNVSMYDGIRDEEHLVDLMYRPINWAIFENQEFVSKLFHLSNYSVLVSKLKPTSIEEIAMTLAIIRPGKKHLQSKCLEHGFDSIKDDVWTKDNDEYLFKKAHGIGYAVAVYVHANLLLENEELLLSTTD
jgi:DNA polymerase III alpha subunit